MEKLTVKNLSEMNGRVYVYLSDAEIGKQFLQQAESEGFIFTDGVMPTDRKCEEVMAVNHDGTINYVGTCGRIAFNGGADKVNGEDFIRINYKKYAAGAKDYLYDYNK